MNYNKPHEIINIVKETAIDKAGKSTKQMAILAILGGAYIALGSMFAVIVAGGMESLAITDPGLVKLVFGLTFPVGFLLVSLAGAELFTSTTAIMSTGVFNKVTTFKKLLIVWMFSYVGNFIGSLLTVYLLAYPSDIFATESYRTFIFSIAEHKTSHTFLTTFVKGVGANWLVCLASFLTYSSKDVTGKIIALWIPVTAFVAMGFEHSIANMFFIPMAKVLGADISWSTFIFKNLIPVTLGNITGGVVLVSLAYSTIYRAKLLKE